MRHLKEKLKSNSGFTLVELMIVVAIIGILAAIAIPNYQKYQARARQGEAKLQLASVFTAETSYAAEKSSFTQCLIDVGYQPTGNTFYYTTGFGTATGASGLCGPIGNSSCIQYNWPPTGGAGTPCTAGPGGAGAIDALGQNFVGNAKVLAAPVTVATVANLTGVVGAGAGTTMTQTVFTAGAVGQVSSSPPAPVAAQGVPAGVVAPAATTTNYDAWVINQNKSLINASNGI